MNLARLNHVLIPSKDRRDQFLESRFGRMMTPLMSTFRALTNEGRYLLLLCLVCGVGGLGVEYSQAYILWAILFGLIVASLAFRWLFALKDVRTRLDLPRRTTVGDTITFSITLHNDGDVEHQSIRVSGPFMPWFGKYVGPSPTLTSLPPGASRQVEVRAVFSLRGEHHLDAFFLAPMVPLGLACGKGIFTEEPRFLVVPAVAPVKDLVTPTSKRYQPGGVALASQTGESMELMGVRPYRPGDAIRDIHARSWARLGEPVVREYRQEYFTRIGIVLDTSFTAAEEEKMEAAISLAAGVVAYLSRGEALIDLLLIGDEVHRLTLGRSLGFLEQALDLLACTRAGPELDPSMIETRLGPFLPQLSCVVLITGKWDPARRELADTIRSHGAGCRVLRVVERIDVGEEIDGDSTPVPVKSILSAQELFL